MNTPIQCNYYMDIVSRYIFFCLLSIDNLMLTILDTKSMAPNGCLAYFYVIGIPDTLACLIQGIYMTTNYPGIPMKICNQGIHKIEMRLGIQHHSSSSHPTCSAGIAVGGGRTGTAAGGGWV